MLKNYKNLIFMQFLKIEIKSYSLKLILTNCKILTKLSKKKLIINYLNFSFKIEIICRANSGRDNGQFHSLDIWPSGTSDSNQ